MAMHTRINAARMSLHGENAAALHEWICVCNLKTALPASAPGAIREPMCLKRLLRRKAID
jgi:hypothetical protein